MILNVVIMDNDYNARRDIDNKEQWVQNDFELTGETNDGKEVLSLLSHVPPHVIVTEIRIRRMDGINFIEAAKRR